MAVTNGQLRRGETQPPGRKVQVEALMMKRTLAAWLLTVLLCLTQGCAYLQNRVNDAVEVIDIGVTVSDSPCLSGFVIFPPIHLTLVGIGMVDGWFTGLGGGRLQAFCPYYQNSIGLGVWGEETVSFGKSAKDLPLNNEEELRKQATFYRSGLFGLMQGPLPTEDYWISCPHYVHIGFVGAVFSPRYSEIADFFLGWLLIDINGDDVAGETPAVAPPSSGAKAVPASVALQPARPSAVGGPKSTRPQP